jgi:hypothetical protein
LSTILIMGLGVGSRGAGGGLATVHCDPCWPLLEPRSRTELGPLCVHEVLNRAPIVGSWPFKSQQELTLWGAGPHSQTWRCLRGLGRPSLHSRVSVWRLGPRREGRNSERNFVPNRGHHEPPQWSQTKLTIGLQSTPSVNKTLMVVAVTNWWVQHKRISSTCVRV